ncbi:hypothetical protein KCTC52924_02000 [Arenibacter antarcticus]|uniref:SusD/RagB family nutrient-binding outer membrane lipoprotein n=2 Tax=Flavobacteriaceae TaxID=49546 RepID=A0ABW5VGC0_9FLAO
MKNLDMKKNSIMALVFTCYITLIGCTTDFEEINTNPNSPEFVETSQLLAAAQSNAKSTLFTRERTSMMYAQHWAETDYTDESTYANPESSFYSFYSGCLADLEAIIKLNTDEKTKSSVVVSGSNNNQLAVARILKAWVYMNLTDIWGEVPYSEALQGNLNASPKYDPQSEIYTDLIKELKEASLQIEADDLPVKGDIIYNGDMMKWRKFANSLLLRIGIRLSKVAPETGKKIVVDALAAGIFESNDDNALYTHLEDENNANDHYINFIRRQDYAVSNTMIAYMEAGSLSAVFDPRIEKYANPAENPDPSNGNVFYIGDYGGMPYGLTSEAALDLSNTLSSFPGDAVRSKTTPAILMSYPELLFIQAEAIERGWIAGEAKDKMKEAVAASMGYWEISDEKAQIYIDGLLIDPNSMIETIMTQKWIALYMQGITAWSEWRRTNYPVLSPGPYTQATDQIPRRRSYDSEELTLNGTNVKAAIERQGPDSFETRVWWDKE